MQANRIERGSGAGLNLRSDSSDYKSGTMIA